MKVLVIDDSDDIRFIARFALTRFGGMEVIEASGGREGIEAARGQRPDVILLDLGMTEMSGAETLAILKQDPATAAIPVLLLTGAPPNEAQLRTLGACGVVCKPFDALSLPATVRAAAAVA
jgi:CheY-like chemotaxis protein